MTRHLLAILALPFVVVVAVPALIVWAGREWDVHLSSDPAARLLFMGIGLALWLAGFLLTAWCIRLFGRVGQGTLAPWDPTRRLVIVGPYRYVRNPMIAGVLAMLLGESLVLGSVFLLTWTALFWLANWGYFLLSEEPKLLRRFGAAYEQYRANVPRWIPRLSAWVPSDGILADNSAGPGAAVTSGEDVRASRMAETGWLWPMVIAGVVVAGVCVTAFTVIALLRPSSTRVRRIEMATSAVPRRIYLAEEIRKEGAHHKLEIVLTSRHYGGLEALEEVNSPGSVHFALVPGGVQSGDLPTVRQVATLATEPLHVLVRPELAGTGLARLRGKRIAVGPPSMATHHLSREVLASISLHPATEQKGGYTLDPVSPEDLYRELQRIDSLAETDRVEPLYALPDAVVFCAPVPSMLAEALIRTGNYQLLPVPFAEAFCSERLNPPNAQGVQVQRSMLTQTTIPAYTYRFDPPMPAQACPTVGMPLLLVADQDVDPEAVSRLLETIYESPLRNQIRAQPLEDQVAAFPLHPATEHYMHRTEPILKPEHASKIGPLLGGIGTLITGLIAFYSYMRLRKLKRFESYYRDIGHIDMLARGLAMDPDSPTNPKVLRTRLETRLTQLKHDILMDFADGGLQGEGLMAGLIALINDTRESLASMEARDFISPDAATKGSIVRTA
jgi:protein-S-isoprenylcysteine O-methyltransferase Ste14